MRIRVITSVLALAMVLAWAVPTRGQAHPCDVQAPTSGTLSSGAPMTVYFCGRAADNLTNVRADVNGQIMNLGSPSQITAQPNAAGQVQFSVLLGQFAKGSYVVRVTVFNFSLAGQLQESLPSDPFRVIRR
jgi:hypothetical protein